MILLTTTAMIGEKNRLLVTEEPVVLEKQPVEFGRKSTDHFRGRIYRIYPV